MSRVKELTFVVVVAVLVVLVLVYVPIENSILGKLMEQYTEPDWEEIASRNIVKSAIPIILLDEIWNGQCRVGAELFSAIITHPEFLRSEELMQKLKFDTESLTLVVPCDELSGEKSRLIVWFVTEEAPSHSTKYQYWITSWEETNMEKGL